MTEEIWKDVQEFPSYRVSNLGNVLSLNYNKTGVARLLVPKTRRAGYLVVTLGKDNHRFIHRLVGIAFIPNPENKPQINHINFITSDNRLENLEWCTALENAQHSRRLNPRVYPVGEAASQCKLSDKQISEIRDILATETRVQARIAEQFGVKPSLITLIKQGVHRPECLPSSSGRKMGVHN